MANEYYQSPKQLAMIDKENRMAMAYKKITTHCECGHSFIIPNYVDRLICNHCGNYVYRTKEIEKQYKFKDFERKFNKYLKDSKEKMKDVNRIEGRKLGVQQTTKNRKKTR